MTNFSVLVFVKSMLNEKLMPNIQVFEKKQLNVNVTWSSLSNNYG